MQALGQVLRAERDPRGVRPTGGERGPVGVRAAGGGDDEPGGALVFARLGSAPPEGLLRPQLRVRLRAGYCSGASASELTPHPIAYSAPRR